MLASQFSLAFPVEFLQKPRDHLNFIMKFGKFLTVQMKWAFRNDGLFHVIYAEESTKFLVKFEDS